MNHKIKYLSEINKMTEYLYRRQTKSSDDGLRSQDIWCFEVHINDCHNHTFLRQPDSDLVRFWYKELEILNHSWLAMSEINISIGSKEDLYVRFDFGSKWAKEPITKDQCISQVKLDTLNLSTIKQFRDFLYWNVVYPTVRSDIVDELAEARCKSLGFLE